MQTAKAKSPAFQFYARDWISSQRVSLMTLEAEGAYIRLLSYCWLHGSIPADPDKLAQLIGKGASTSLASDLVQMFLPHPHEPGLLIHERHEQEREKQRIWSEKSAAGGRKSAKVRQQQGKKPRVVEPPLEGWLPNGTNQKPTLQSASASALIHAPAKPARERNPLFEALAQAESSTLDQLTKSASGRIGKALQEIKSASPGVTPAEIAHRASCYRLLYPNAACTSTALASNWAKLDGRPAVDPLKGLTIVP